MNILILIVKRILLVIPTIFCVVSLVFLLVHATPGNPFQNEKSLSPEVLAALLHKYYLDLPLWQQFILYWQHLLHGDFGQSYKFIGHSINELLFPNYMGGFWVTLELSIYTMLITIPLGVLLGIYAGLHQDSFLDRVIVSCNMFFNAVPAIITGPLLILVFAVSLHLLPSNGFGDGNISYLVLPLAVLILAYTPTVTFITRGSILEVLNANFIRTAKAKGLSMRVIVFRHAIRPTLIPVISILGPMFASILVGALVTEQIFTLPGLGALTTNGATNRDYNLVLAITILGSTITILFNLIVDILYCILDPRVKQ
jgi:oligopeptide transport system permease protein